MQQRNQYPRSTRPTKLPRPPPRALTQSDVPTRLPRPRHSLLLDPSQGDGYLRWTPPRKPTVSSLSSGSQGRGRGWGGGTSLISHFAMSGTVSPARRSAIGIAREGAIVKSIGLVAASAQESILAIGFKDSLCARSAVLKTRADAPSLIELAFAAVIVPFFLCQVRGTRGGLECWL
jgi:hypothetical protein